MNQTGEVRPTILDALADREGKETKLREGLGTVEDLQNATGGRQIADVTLYGLSRATARFESEKRRPTVRHPVAAFLQMAFQQM